jgi:hypothetical protein
MSAEKNARLPQEMAAAKSNSSLIELTQRLQDRVATAPFSKGTISVLLSTTAELPLSFLTLELRKLN